MKPFSGFLVLLGLVAGAASIITSIVMEFTGEPSSPNATNYECCGSILLIALAFALSEFSDRRDRVK